MWDVPGCPWLAVAVSGERAVSVGWVVPVVPKNALMAMAMAMAMAMMAMAMAVMAVVGTK